MRAYLRDMLATLVVAAILVAYLAFLAGGSMPLIHDTLAMAATAFVGWVVVFVLAGRYDTASRGGVTELVLFAVSIALGAGAVLAAETSTVFGPVLLAVFLVAVAVTWGVRLRHDHRRSHRPPLVTR